MVITAAPLYSIMLCTENRLLYTVANQWVCMEPAQHILGECYPSDVIRVAVLHVSLWTVCDHACVCVQVRQRAERGPGGGAEGEEPEGEAGPGEGHAGRRRLQPPPAAGGLCLGGHFVTWDDVERTGFLFLCMLTLWTLTPRTRTWRCVPSAWSWRRWGPSCWTSTHRSPRTRLHWPRSAFFLPFFLSFSHVFHNFLLFSFSVFNIFLPPYFFVLPFSHSFSPFFSFFPFFFFVLTFSHSFNLFSFLSLFFFSLILPIYLFNVFFFVFFVLPFSCS